MPLLGGNKLPVCFKPNSGSAVTAEAAGSSPVVPATSIQCLTDLRSHQLFSLEDGSKPKTNSSHYHWWFPKTLRRLPRLRLLCYKPNMRKWMRERLQRRKKKPAAGGGSSCKREARSS